MRPWARSAARSSAASSVSSGGSWPAARRRSSSASAAGVSGSSGGRRGRRAARPARGLGLRLAALEPREAGEQVAARAVAGRVGVEHDAAAERVGRRERADHERGRRAPGRAAAPGAAGSSGRRARRAARRSRACRGGPRRACRRRAGASGVAQVERDVDAVGGARAAPPAATITSPRATSSRATPARLSATRWPASARSTRLVVDLDGAHARARAGGQDQHLVAARGGARPQRAGDDGAGAADRERAVDVQAQRAAARRAAAHARGGPLQRRAQLRRCPRPAAPPPARPRRPAAAPPPPPPPARDRRGRPS